MKIIKNNSEDFVYPEDLSSNNIIVGKFNDNYYILTANTDGFHVKKYSLRVISNVEKFTDGVYGFGCDNDFQKYVKRMLDYGVELHAFKEWREALEWLLDN